MPKPKTKIEKIYCEFEHKIINGILNKINRDDLPYDYLWNALISLGALREKLTDLEHGAWLDQIEEEIYASIK